MAQYLSFEEVASELKCSIKKVRKLVIEDKSIRATRITPNGLVLTSSGLDDHFPYDLDFCSHLNDEGEITSDIYRIGASGQTEKIQTLIVGYLRVERNVLDGFNLDEDSRDVPSKSSSSVTHGTAPAQSPATAALVEPVSVVAVVDSLSGTAVLWTTARKEAARKRRNELRGQGNKSFAAKTAAEFGVTATRLREVLNDKPKKAPSKKVNSTWYP